MKIVNAPTFIRFLLLCLVMVSTNSVTEARIGESLQVIERRIFSNGGIRYRDDEILENRTRSIPYLKFMNHLPLKVDRAIYFKTHDGRKPKSSDMDSRRMLPGWDLHVLYVNGKSALEYYKRSQGISEYELNQLMVLQSGSGWKKVDLKAAARAGEPPASALGFTFLSSDESVRAKQVGGDGVLFFRADLDVAVAEKELKSLQESAPRSVAGF